MLDKIKVGNTISILRKERGLTGEELVAKLGVTAQTVSKWENGKCLPETARLPALAKSLGVSIDMLLMPMSFEDIIEMKAIPNLLLLPDDLIATALKGASPTLREHFFTQLTRERNAAVRESMETQGAVRISEVEWAQGEVLRMIRG